MATNTGESRRIGAVHRGSQVQNPITGDLVKFHEGTGRIMANKECRFKRARMKKRARSA